MVLLGFTVYPTNPAVAIRYPALSLILFGPEILDVEEHFDVFYLQAQETYS